MSPSTGYLVQTLVTLLAVCVIAVVVLWVGRRMGLGRASGPIELRGHLPLDPRRTIYLVKVGEHVFVVGVGEGVFTKLGEMPANELPSGDVAPSAAFRDTLARALQRRSPS
ncbi:MAG: flagellar biosynthetic protein FliO [Polyangiaceae bacterium]